ncbi:prolyl endopeptidase [Idiomarina xiamenensis 10-D-4]|uniref:prolyl oligopeptidase n=1 Tax=Idiomarina xiamenensis 10-D-4 TaxID=740709 RepID=K2L1Q2_9GAMM|nr:prolyl endopeptidase [Idiomarina xiamenensis 10-D-4]
MSYPETKRVDQVDNYHGTEVADPYRWLEQDSAAVSAWVDAQNDFSRPYLESLPARERIKQQLTGLWNYEKVSTPEKHAGKYFFYRNDGLQNQSVLYTQDNLDSPPQILIDPNSFSDDGTVSLARTSISPEARYIAYAKSDGGSDWTSWHVRDIRSGEDLTDVLTGTKFTSVSWHPDGDGFFYSRYPENANGDADDSQPVAVYYHQLGDDQQQDALVYQRSDKATWNPYPQVTDDGRYLLIDIFEGYTANAVYYRPLNDSDAEFKPLFAKWDAQYNYVTSHDGQLYFRTTKDAPTGRVIAVDTKQPEMAQWQQIVPAQKQTLDSISAVGSRLFANYLQDARSRVAIYDMSGGEATELALPGIGSISGFGGDKDSDETFFSFTSFTEPGKIYRYRIADDHRSLWHETEVPLDLSNYETEQVFYESKDGTRVPMFIIHRKGLTLNGQQPTLLYGYGGFNVSLTPSYSVTRMVWLEMGGVLAIPNLRGGGEYGEAWHQAGTKQQKQNVFDDFVAAAEWLIANNYTNSDKLAIQGGSNGGLLVGATLLQRPDLFAAALPAVGVLDMLRYHLPSANARGWSSDYGLSENADEFAALYAYSPVHNVEPGTCYPATLITTGDHDNRVVPWHSYKFAAALQHGQGCDKPVLLRVETRAGHGAGTPTWMRIEGYADQWAFLAEQLGMTF